MIEKERLEELIKQEATIYRCYADVGVYELRLKNVRVDTAYLWVNGRIGIPLDSLFETKEEAEFVLKYQNVTRTETLSLPTFEEFTINDKYNYYGTSYFEFGDGYRLIVKLPSEDDDCEFIGIDVNGNCELYHWEEATKENYYAACELCRKLFLGEKV